MDIPLGFQGWFNVQGALLPAFISLAVIVARRANSKLTSSDQFWLGLLSLALSVVMSRVHVSPDVVALHILPGATILLCYLVWRGHYVSPGLAFALTYATCLPVDFCLAQYFAGADFRPECVGGAGWADGLLVFPTLNALAIAYANWRIKQSGSTGQIWFGQKMKKRNEIGKSIRYPMRVPVSSRLMHHGDSITGYPRRLCLRLTEFEMAKTPPAPPRLPPSVRRFHPARPC